jgi:cation:H+ antiporter
MSIAMFILGLITLVGGAQLLVRGASRLALSFGISPLVVGLTVVAFGTSAPELAVSVQSAWSGQVDIALGNVVGSNIFNVLFILGLSALIAPLLVHRAADPAGSADDGRAFAAALAAGQRRRHRPWRRPAAGQPAARLHFPGHPPEPPREPGRRRPNTRRFAAPSTAAPGTATGWRSWLLVVGGLALLVLGSNWLVDAAVSFARAWG